MSRCRPQKKNSAVARDLPFVRLLIFESRLAVVWLVQALSISLFPPQDTDAFQSIPGDHTHSLLDSIVHWTLSGFYRWDAIHFVHIAQYGYTYENNLAFFPLYPCILQLFTKSWYWLVPTGWLGLKSALIISGFLTNLLCFLGAGYALFKFTEKVFRNLPLAYLTLLCFAVNPASIFFTSCYSESLYSFLTWLGLFCLYTEASLWRRVTEASVCFSLSLLTRSNGILNCGFIAYVLLAAVLNAKNLREYLSIATLALLSAALVLVPFGLHQMAVYKQFCSHTPPFIPAIVRAVASEKQYVLPGELDQLWWCSKPLPLSYGAVQARYWHVELLGYFQLRKIPCFLLAAPALLMSLFACLKFFPSAGRSLLGALKEERSLLPFCVHLASMCTFSALFVNIEVITRLVFSASPLLYWYTALLLREDLPPVESSMKTVKDMSLWTIWLTIWRLTQHGTTKIITAYFLSYCLVGTCLHSVFLPWT